MSGEAIGSALSLAGWALAHSLWQGALVTLATAAGLRLARGHAPETRYRLASAARPGPLPRNA